MPPLQAPTLPWLPRLPWLRVAHPDSSGCGALVCLCAASGSTVGQFVLVPLFEHLAERHGWRTGYVCASIATAALAPLAFCLLTMAKRELSAKEAAAAKQAYMDGHGADCGSAVTQPPPLLSACSRGVCSAGRAPEQAVAGASLWVKLARLVRSRLYWGLTVSFVVCGITTTGFVEAHLVAFATHHGPLPTACPPPPPPPPPPHPHPALGGSAVRRCYASGQACRRRTVL